MDESHGGRAGGVEAIDSYQLLPTACCCCCGCCSCCGCCCCGCCSCCSCCCCSCCGCCCCGCCSCCGWPDVYSVGEIHSLLSTPTPSTTINHHQPPPTTTNYHQPPPTTTNHHQPPSTITNNHQPPPTTYLIIHILVKMFSCVLFLLPVLVFV